MSAPNQSVSPYLWFLFALCFAGNVLAGTASTLMSVYLPIVVRDLLGSVEASRYHDVSAYINALYFVGWALGGFTWGFIGDRIGRARSLSLAVGMFGVFTAMTAWATSWEVVMICRFFCGFGVGGTLVLNTTLLSEVWPAKSKAIFIGILSIGFPVGIFSSGAVNYFVSGWRDGFLMGALPLAVGILSLWLMKESELWKSTRQEDDRAVRAEVNANIITGSIVFGSMLIGLWAVFSWVPTWVQSLMTTSDGQHERGMSMMLLGAGGLSGGFFSGWISNAIGLRRSMLFCFAGSFLLSMLLFKLNTSFGTIAIIETGLLAFVFGISQGVLSVYIPLLFPVAVRARATGICFNAGRFFTAAAVFFVGAWVAVFGGYGNSLFAFSIVFMVGFLILFFSNKMSDANGTY